MAHFLALNLEQNYFGTMDQPISVLQYKLFQIKKQVYGT